MHIVVRRRRKANELPSDARNDKAFEHKKITPFPGIETVRCHPLLVHPASSAGYSGAWRCYYVCKRISSVVNMYLKHWRVPSLFVSGASAFPQNPSGNPTLTALALT